MPIIDDTIVEPCEAFYLNLTSSAERSHIVDDDLPNTVIIYDDEGTINFRLYINKKKIEFQELTLFLQMSMSCFSSTTLHKSLEEASLWTTPYLGVLKFYVKSQGEQTNLTVSIIIYRLHIIV